MKKNISRNPLWPDWYNGKKIDEVQFGRAFLEQWPLKCVNGTLYTLDGPVEDESEIKQRILENIEEYVTSGLSKKVTNILETIKLLAFSDPFPIEQDCIHLQNGVYHLPDGSFQESRLFCQNRLPVRYDPKAATPDRWLTFLHELLDDADIPTLQEYLGYCLIPSTKGQKMMLIVGKGGEGKSRIGLVLKRLMGDAASNGSVQKVENNRFARADLERRLLMIDDDMDMNALPKTNYIKTIVTAEAKLDLERKGVQSYQRGIYARFLCFGNGALTSLYDHSDGFFRRQLILTTKDKPADRTDDPFLVEKMCAELEGILLWCGVCLAGYAVKVAGYALSTMLAHVSAYTILEGLRLQVADQLMRAPLGEVESRPIGAMKSTIVDRIEDVEPPLAHMIPELSSNLLLPLAVVIAMFAIDWRMGLALLVTIPVALVPMAAGMRSYNKNYAAYMAANNHVNSVIVEYVEGIQVVKAFSQGERSYAKFAQAVSSFRDFTLNWFRCTWASMNLCLSILPTTLLGTLPVGIYLYQTGVLDPAQVTLCLMMALGIVSPLMRATAFINSMKSMQFAVKDTRELLDLPQLSQAKQEADLDGSGIRFRNVAFSYGGTGGAEVLHDLELHIPQGSFTALVGPSGGGKSTIARLAARFWDVTAGSITLGGRDIREMPLKQLSQAISFVTQDNFLFDCSLKENIRLGKPDASDEEVLAAARAAQCEEFLARLDRGWDTPAGEAGRQLSGGERQRIAIARAILKDAPIVILDEATAFTDPENEDKIQSSIMALSKGKTLLVIAHRLSTIQNADQIVVLEKGHIVDQGTQAELLRRCLLYQKLWQAHIGAQGWAVTSGAKEGQ